jgi:hypothetical protein
MSKKPSTNEFFSLGNFPKDPGIIYYGLSIPLLHNTQSPQNCYDVDLELMHKVQVSNVGAQIVYTDSLYMYSPEPAMDLKLKYQKLIEGHKQAWMNLIKKNVWLIPSGFTFMTWSQLMLDCPKFSTYLTEFHRIYERDVKLQEYVAKDIEGTGRETNQYSVGYMLEEILLDYMVMKGQVRLRNDYTQDREEWILNVYPGKPHRSHVYLHQQNFFKLHNKQNVYENCWYNSHDKKLYEFERLDVETFNFSK